MIFILVSWLYVAFLAFCIGNTAHSLLGKLVQIQDETPLHFTLASLSGLLAMTFITTVLCLFIPLDLLSNLVLLILALLCLLFNKNRLQASWNYNKKLLGSTSWLLRVLFILFVFIIAYISYEPSSHHDDGLYYSQSIKWLQEYGTVKGIANLNSRMGFNSSWFILQANCGFRFLNLGLFNDLNGLIFLYMLIYSLGGINRLIKGNTSLSNIVRALFFLPLLIFHRGATDDVILYNINFITSASVDVPVCMLLWLIFLLFLEAEEPGSPSFNFRHLLIIFYSTWLVTMKIAAVPVLTLSFFIIVRLVVNRKIKHVAYILPACLLLVTPWIVRNVLVSGYLLFPFSALDILHVDWKVPLIRVIRHEIDIKETTVGLPTEAQKIPMLKWIPIWFAKLTFTQMVSLVLCAVNTIVFCLVGAWQLVRGNSGFFKKYFSRILFIVTAVAGILFWLDKAPDFRFGYGFIMIYCAFSVALFLRYFLEDLSRYIGWLAAAYVVYAACFYYSDELTHTPRMLFVRPLPYRMPAVTMKDVIINHGQVVHVVPSEDLWNAPLPAAVDYEYNEHLPVLRKTTIKDGFLPSNRN